jgi:luciferase family oxidoreductase group 1
MTTFSVLEQAPTRAGASGADAIRAALTFAQGVDRLGYSRFWIAEHHAIGAVASTAPEVLIGHVASATERMRIGSGGILLPNHRPIHVAEQFLTLAALHPGRIDLGIGRSEGALHEPTVRAFMRPQDTEHGAGFDEQLDQLLAFGGVRPLPAGHPLAEVRAGPSGVPLPPVFLLGSTPRSAATAARLGLGYGFAAYTNPDAVVDALQTYRREFVPAGPGDRPHAILGLKVLVGRDDEHAEALALPWNLALVQSRAGHPPRALMSVEDAQRHRWSEAERAAEQKVDRRADVIGGPERARRLLQTLVERTEADEVIVSTNTFDPHERIRSYERLAATVDFTRPPRPQPAALPGWV